MKENQQNRVNERTRNNLLWAKRELVRLKQQEAEGKDRKEAIMRLEEWQVVWNNKLGMI